MKITVFTSNQRRHNFLINSLSKISSQIFVVQESRSLFPGKLKDFYPKSKLMKGYFRNVEKAEKKIFGDCFIKSKKNISLLPIKLGDLNSCSKSMLKNFLKSDLYIVFGSSYIKGFLINFLIKKKAINIHMGVSPYYRGTDCNFWSLYDNNVNFTGATMHLISKGLDSGDILYHALSNVKSSPFEYTMSTVKSAIISLQKKIKDKSIFKLSPSKQNKKKEIRYSKKKDFNDKAIRRYNKMKINLKKDIKYDLKKYKNPFILKKIG